MKINPYLQLNGRCKEAFEFYAQALGAKIDMMMTFGQSPDMPASPAWQDKIMHASLSVGDQMLMGSDGPEEHPATPQGFSIALSVPTAAEMERIFGELADGGTVRMPPQETFWAGRFGMLVDRFGIAWMLNGEPKEMPQG